MLKAYRLFLISLFLLVLFPRPTAVQETEALGPAIVTSTCTSWQGTYFNDARGYNVPPVVKRNDARIDFDWGYGAPAPGMVTDHFSVRWQCTVHFVAGTHRFTATSDDGLRLYVDGQPIIDEWHDHPAQTFHGEVTLAEGAHEVIVTYYENTGLAVARVSWAAVSGPTPGWQGEYYDNPTLSGSPVRINNDAEIDFDWGYESWAPGGPLNNFSVRWTRTLHFEPGWYRFTTTTDDGVRLWVGELVVIDQWHDQWAQSHSATIYLSGEALVRMETYEHAGVAVARLQWTRAGEPSTGEVIVDDGDPGFVKGGAAAAWHSSAGGFDDHLWWTRVNDRVRSNYNWARWYPDLVPGRYEVLVYIPERYTTTARARYWVSHRDGLTLSQVDQSANGGRWVSLGSYRFEGTRRDYVSLADVTFEPYLSRLIAFDAVKWVAR